MSQCTSTMVLMSAPPPSQWYGLDIETDTTINGLDARVAAIVAVAVSTAEEDFVLSRGAHHLEWQLLRHAIHRRARRPSRSATGAAVWAA